MLEAQQVPVQVFPVIVRCEKEALVDIDELQVQFGRKGYVVLEFVKDSAIPIHDVRFLALVVRTVYVGPVRVKDKGYINQLREWWDLNLKLEPPNLSQLGLA